MDAGTGSGLVGHGYATTPVPSSAMEEGRSGEYGREWGREEMQGCGGCLVEQHRRPPPPLVDERRRRPRELARGGPSAATVGVAPSRLGETTRGERF